MNFVVEFQSILPLHKEITEIIGVVQCRHVNT
jgi:hypothetical protein